MSCFPCFIKKDEEDGELSSEFARGVKTMVNKNDKMNCFPYFIKKDEEDRDSGSEFARGVNNMVNKNDKRQMLSDKAKPINSSSINKDGTNGNFQVQTFTFLELATATKNFTPDCLIGEGGFGRVYKGYLESTKQVVAIKQLDRNGMQGNKEFIVEVLMLGLLHHPNLVNLIGYCADGEQRLLVYEFMSLGSLEDHLLDLKPDKKPLKWYTRMKIAYGAAQGLEYLHEKANPPVIYRDLKSSNILLDEDYNPKLADFGLAKLSPVGDKFNVASSVMGTYGYCAPEYARIGELTLRSDVYSFGVLLLELLSGRRVINTMCTTNEQNLVAWAQPMLKDQKRFPELVDPLLKCAYPTICLNQAVGIAAMCLQQEASVRPFMADVVTALGFLAEEPPLTEASSIPSHIVQPPIPEEKTQPILTGTNKYSHHVSNRSSITMPLQKLLEFNQSSNSLYSEHSSQGNEDSSSSSMNSVHSENTTHQESCNPSSNLGQASNQHHNDFEKYYFQHCLSAQERYH